MKPTTITLISCAILLAGSMLCGQDGPGVPPDPPKRAFGNGVLPEFLAVYDVNDDGSLSVEENQALNEDRNKNRRIDTFRRRWDANNDGAVSPAERETAKNAIRQIIIQRRCRRFAEVDADENGSLSPTEFNAIGAVQSIDNTNPGTANDLFLHLDKDGNNAISKAEFLRSLDAAPTQALGVQPAPPHPNATAP